MSFVIAIFLMKLYCIKQQPFLGISCTFQFPNIVLLRGAADDNEVHDFTYIGTQFTFLCEHIFNVFTYIQEAQVGRQ